MNRPIRPDFAQFIGDNVQDATDDQFHLFLDVASRLASPYGVPVGDHDVKDDPRADRFRRHVGPDAWFANEVDSAIEGGERCDVF